MRFAGDVLVKPSAERLLVALYLGAIVSANAVAGKLFEVAGVTVTAGAIAIPIVFIATDLINELYGLRAARHVVWMGFLANGVLVAIVAITTALPSSPLGVSQSSFAAVFDLTWRVVVGSSIAYLISSLVDVRLFHLIKLWTGGRWFWLRKNGSTVVSQAIDTAIFVTIAFGGVIPADVLVPMAVGQYLVKIAMAPLGTPISYAALCVARRWS